MPVGRRSARWGRRLGPLLVLAALGAACGDDDGPDPTTTSTTATTEASSTSSTSTTSTIPEREPSTTTTAFDPATVEGEVEAAYLKSWDTYADAVYNLELDEEALAEVYAEASLETRRAEIEDRISKRRSALVNVDHDYEITIVDATTAAVTDHLTNHQVLIDIETRTPIEDDPNERLLLNFQLKKLEGVWKVTLMQKVDL